MNGQNDDRLRLIIERIERLEAKKKGISDDIRDVWAEFHEVEFNLYKTVLEGGFKPTPLGAHSE